MVALTLVSIGGFWLRSDAAASLARCFAAGAPRQRINSATRSYALQADWYAHQGQDGYPAMADNPDKSKHVWRPDDPQDKGARAIDCDDPLRRWLRRYGRPYGWTFPIKSEKWHAEYGPAGDTKRPKIKPITEEDLMGAADDILAELSAIRTKLDRHDRQYVVFKIAGDPLDRWCVAAARTHTWAIAPSDTIYNNWRRYVLPQFLAGEGQDAMAVREWPGVYVADPGAFGRQVPWVGFTLDDEALVSPVVDPAEVAAALAPMLEEAVIAELTSAGLLTADRAGPVMEAALRRVFAQLG